jgi:hypothetical protein
MNKRISFLLLIIITFLLTSCEEGKVQYQDGKNTAFTLIPSSHSGIKFINSIDQTMEFNFLSYPYIYTGTGVCIGDINNDGLDDVFFASNQKRNQIHLNKGNLEFENISKSSGIEDSEGWTTGASMIDINNDGWLDIYICKSGVPNNDNLRKNKLFINNKDNTFSERAHEYNLDDPGFSTQAYFLDFDKDGDLDMYLVNHRIDFKNNTLISGKIQRDKSPLTSDKLYKNENGKFKNVYENGINKTWGLSASIADFNNDSWLDIYVCNDYLEPDHLFINNKNGGFNDSILHFMDHISFNSMGSDVADINNDGKLDLIVLDMLSPDHVRSKRNMASMNSDNFNNMVNVGYHHQYMSNVLQLNRNNNGFSEIAQYAGISKTDWSWASLLADFDNDGYRDLYITNGVFKDVSDNDLQRNLNKKQAKGIEMTLDEVLKTIPSEKLNNHMYSNLKNTRFSNKTIEWGLDHKSFSNGAAYGDLDNDGDLDLVVNNMAHEAFVYRNNASNNFISINLAGDPKNIMGIGSIIEVFTSDNYQYYQHFLNRGFVSSMSPKINFGIGLANQIDSLKITWDNGKSQLLKAIDINKNIILNIKDAKDNTVNSSVKKNLISKTNPRSYFNYTHKESEYDDFKKEILLPQKMSTQGPQSCVGDVNGDGLEDLFITGAKGFSASLYLQNETGQFTKSNESILEKDKAYEGTGCLFFDYDNDKDLDLYVVSGGNEYAENHSMLTDRFYINDGTGNFSKRTSVFPKINSSGHCVIAADYDNDNDLDLFIGGRVVPGKYPVSPKSYLLQNNNGKFKDVTSQNAPELEKIGMVTDAIFSDYDNDSDLDLIITGEWMTPTVFINNEKKFIPKPLSVEAPEGWWYSITSADFNNDGLPDYFLGNLGVNNKFNVNKNKALHLFADDFDENGNIDIVLAHEQKGEILPLRGRECSSQQMPFIKEKFPDFKSFSEANLDSIYTSEKLNTALHYSVKNFSSVLLINKGNGSFRKVELPEVVQYGPILCIKAIDINLDGYLDIIGAGNIYETEPETVKYDGSKGFVLLNNKKGGFIEDKSHQFLTKGNVKSLEVLKVHNKTLMLVLQNKGPMAIFEINNFK